MESSETSLKSPKSYADVFSALRADINGVEATPTERIRGREGLT